MLSPSGILTSFTLISFFPGKTIEDKRSALEKCLEEVKVGGENYDPDYEKRLRERIVREYEDTLKHRYVVPAHGIAGVNKSCAYPIRIGNVPTTECPSE